MPGGLLQIASSGVQDVYLTKHPEITFFKKVYKRHTNFSIETKEIILEDSPKYDQDFLISIPFYGDLLYRCFFEIEIPKISVDDSYITNSEYISEKANKEENINSEKLKWEREYIVLKSFSDIQIVFYNKANKLLESDNITFKYILNQLLILKTAYSSKLDNTIFKIDEELTPKIDIIGYIVNLDITFGTTDNSEDNVMTYDTFQDNIATLYENNLFYLTYYYSNYIYYKEINDKFTKGEINYAWVENLGNNYFTSYSVELGGQIIETYSNDYLNIYQSHNLKNEEIDNYNTMIGNTEELTNLYYEKDTTKLYVPLIFWFNQSSQNSLPLLALKHSEVKINVQINSLKYLVYFENYALQFEELLVLPYPYSEHTTNDYGVESLEGLEGNIIKVEYKERERIYIYYCEKITQNLLSYHFPNLDTNDLQYLFENYGTDNTTMSKIEWIKFRLAIPNDSSLDCVSKIINGYNHYEYADYNYLLNKFGDPKIKFYCDFINIDETERYKFATSNLEYVICLSRQFTNTLPNSTYYTTELNLLKPTKDVYIFIKPLLSTQGLSESDIKIPNMYNYYYLLDDDILSSLKATLNGETWIDTKYGFNLYEITNRCKYLNRYDDNFKFYYYCFGLHPEEHHPTGSSNLSIIRGKILELVLNSDFLSGYYDTELNLYQVEIELIVISKKYNLLRINKGKAELAFY